MLLSSVFAVPLSSGACKAVPENSGKSGGVHPQREVKPTQQEYCLVARLAGRAAEHPP